MRLSAVTLLPILVFAAGCSANVVTSAEADAESSPAAAIIAVERITGENPRTEAVARFVRGRTGPLDDKALRFLGLEPEVPAIGSCLRVSTDVPTMPSGGVRLLDVGRVSLNVETPGREPFAADLSRRRVPDVVDEVSGVVYAASALELPTRGTFEVRVVGEPELGAVRAQADFAGEPAQIRVQGQESGIAIAPEGGVDVAWETTGERRTEAATQVIYVDVADARRTSVTRCAFADLGHAWLPASAFEGDGSITIHRLHRSSFRTAGIDRGELRLDFAREFAFTLRARR